MTDKEKLDKLEADMLDLTGKFEKLVLNVATFLSPDTPDKTRFNEVCRKLKEDGEHKKEVVMP